MASILIVDDDPDIRSLLRIMLNVRGHDVKESENGSLAVKEVQRQHFDLVITDLIMPDKEGIETIIELRKNHSDIKIIAMSGGGLGRQQDYLAMAQKLGATRTLEKPFGIKELNEAVDGVLGIG